MNLLPMIQDRLSSGKNIIFARTDPGIVMTSVMVPMPLKSVIASINLFQALSSTEGSFDDKVLKVDHLPKTAQDHCRIREQCHLFEGPPDQAAAEEKAWCERQEGEKYAIEGEAGA